jgi:transposase-like protein
VFSEIARGSMLEDTLMTITLEQFREAVSARRGGRKHGARRYDDDFVAFAVQHTGAVVASGRSVHAAAKELGISMMTIQGWQRRAIDGGGVVPSGKLLRSVRVSPASSTSDASAGTLRLTTREGHVVSGLNVAQMVALLKALS